jgi:hypothetical protein
VISPDPALHEAAGHAAVRMATWTAQALIDAVTVAAYTPGRSGGAGTARTWRAATDDLFRLVTVEPPCG